MSLRVLWGQSALRKTGDAGQYLVRRLRPHERLGILVMRGEELLNGSFQLADTTMDTTTKLLVGEFSEPPLHQVHPRSVSGSKVQVVARPLGEPVADQRGLVGAVVVDDDVHVEIGGNLGVDNIEKLAELQGPMPTM